jgi:hypothetical protein
LPRRPGRPHPPSIPGERVCAAPRLSKCLQGNGKSGEGGGEGGVTGHILKY